jgi:hypothetical protein
MIHPPFADCEKNIKSPWIRKEGMINLVKTKLIGQGCWLKGVALANFICNGLSYDEFPFHFCVWLSYSNLGWNTNHPPYWCKNVFHPVIFLSKRHLPCFWTDNLPFSRRQGTEMDNSISTTMCYTALLNSSMGSQEGTESKWLSRTQLNEEPTCALCWWIWRSSHLTTFLSLQINTKHVLDAFRLSAMESLFMTLDSGWF